MTDDSDSSADSVPVDDEYAADRRRFAETLNKLKVIDTKETMVLAAIAESQLSTVQELARYVGLNVNSVRGYVTTLRKAFGQDIFQPGAGLPLRLSDKGKHAAEVCQQIIAMQLALVDQRTDVLVKYFPHHSPTVFPAAAKMRERGQRIELSVLGEHHRSIGHFRSRALQPVVAGTYDVAIGIDLAAMSEVKDLTVKLAQHHLYRARLEVMVPVDPDERLRRCIVDGGVSLRKLQSERLPLLTPPSDTRSRKHLRDSMDPDIDTEFVLEEYESKVLIMGAYAGLGTPILPSDVAIQFERREGYCGLLASDDACRFRWLPLLGADGGPIAYNVVAHTRADPGSKTLLFLEFLEQSARELMTRAHRPHALVRE